MMVLVVLNLTEPTARSIQFTVPQEILYRPITFIPTLYLHVDLQQACRAIFSERRRAIIIKMFTLHINVYYKEIRYFSFVGGPNFRLLASTSSCHY